MTTARLAFQLTLYHLHVLQQNLISMSQAVMETLTGVLQMIQELTMNCLWGLLGVWPDLLLDTIVIDTIYLCLSLRNRYCRSDEPNNQRDMSLEHRVINTLEELEVIYAITRTACELLIRTYSHTFAHVTGNCEYFLNRNWISQVPYIVLVLSLQGMWRAKEGKKLTGYKLNNFPFLLLLIIIQRFCCFAS